MMQMWNLSLTQNILCNTASGDIKLTNRVPWLTFNSTNLLLQLIFDMVPEFE